MVNRTEQGVVASGVAPELINVQQSVIAAVALVVGALVYAVARPAGTSHLMPSALTHPTVLPHAIQSVTGSLPTFAHTMALCLLTSAVMATRRTHAGLVCTAWLLVECAFEAGQQREVSAWLATSMPDWFDNVWLLSNAQTYFTRGTFDPADLLAAAAGAAVAWNVIGRTHTKGILT